MKPILFFFKFSVFIYGITCNGQNLPDWFDKIYKKENLNLKYEISNFLKPSALQGDFNGDKIDDLAFSVIDKKTMKKGVMIIHGYSGRWVLICAGSQFGKVGFDEMDNLDWIEGWKLYNEKIVYETKFDADGGIIGGKTRKIKFTGIEIWENIDGYPIAGKVIYWDGKKYDWIHQGE